MTTTTTTKTRKTARAPRQAPERSPDDVRRGERLRARRQALNLDQIAVATLAGLSQPAISAAESGADVKADTVARLAQALNTSTDWLITGAGSADAVFTRNELETRLILELRELDKADFLKFAHYLIDALERDNTEKLLRAITPPPEKQKVARAKATVISSRQTTFIFP